MEEDVERGRGGEVMENISKWFFSHHRARGHLVLNMHTFLSSCYTFKR